MHDQDRWEALGRLAETQAGYFTTAQAKRVGFHRNTLQSQSSEGGRLEHVARGLYRLRFYPRSPFEHVAAAQVLAGSNIAVVSHESALELYRLADVAPSEVHLTLPRSRRHRRAPVGVRLHFPRTPLAEDDVRPVHALRATSPERTIVDVLEAGSQTEQVELAVKQSLAVSLTTEKRLRRAVAGRSKSTRLALERLLSS